MGKAVLQNHMALDVLIASQGGNCAIIQVECGAYISDESSDVTHLMMCYMKNQIVAWWFTS